MTIRGTTIWTYHSIMISSDNVRLMYHLHVSRVYTREQSRSVWHAGKNTNTLSIVIIHCGVTYICASATLVFLTLKPHFLWGFTPVFYPKGSGFSFYGCLCFCNSCFQTLKNTLLYNGFRKAKTYTLFWLEIIYD